MSDLGDYAAEMDWLEQSVTCTNAGPKELCKADNERWAIMLSSQAAGVFVTTRPTAGAVGTYGFQCPTTGGPIILTFRDLGVLVQQQWWGLTAGVSNVVTVWTTKNVR